jgi:uncharacterized spore protein YtfJ
MDMVQMVANARDALTTQRVFGDPITQNGVTVIPVTRISGGGGAGSGEAGPAEDGSEPSGSGGGFGLGVVPAGVFAIRDGAVTWRPAVDVNRVILGGQLVAIVALLVARSYLKIVARRTGAA